jgi:hypothetical protein
MDVPCSVDELVGLMDLPDGHYVDRGEREHIASCLRAKANAIGPGARPPPYEPAAPQSLRAKQKASGPNGCGGSENRDRRKTRVWSGSGAILVEQFCIRANNFAPKRRSSGSRARLRLHGSWRRSSPSERRTWSCCNRDTNTL